MTRYELQPPPGIKVSRIVSLADDLALALAAAGVRIEAPVPGKSVVGIEVPNKETRTVYFRDVVDAPEFQQNKAKLPLALGLDISGNSVVGDLTKHIHLLIAGATGSGKSVCLASIICSLILRAGPQELKLLMIDPKRVELAGYDGLPHLVAPVVTDSKKAASALRWVVKEMEERYRLFAAAGVRNIEGYNNWVTKELRRLKVDPEQAGFMSAAVEVAAAGDGGAKGPASRRPDKVAAPDGRDGGDASPDGAAPGEDGEVLPSAIPYMVVIVDELADLMLVAASDVEDSIARLAQMARAAGIHMILATQRPSVDVVTGLIKANIPSRIAFAVSSHIDSRTVLDMGGAERLLGRGDMLYFPTGASKPTRVQGALLFDNDIEDLVKYWRSQGDPTYAESLLRVERTDSKAEDMDDEYLQQAIELVLDTGQASVSMLQRRFRIGYTRAARLIDMMERRSIVGPYQGSKPRQLLVSDEEAEALRKAGP